MTQGSASAPSTLTHTASNAPGSRGSLHVPPLVHLPPTGREQKMNNTHRANPGSTIPAAEKKREKKRGSAYGVTSGRTPRPEPDVARTPCWMWPARTPPEARPPSWGGREGSPRGDGAREARLMAAAPRASILGVAASATRNRTFRKPPGDATSPPRDATAPPGPSPQPTRAAAGGLHGNAAGREAVP